MSADINHTSLGLAQEYLVQAPEASSTSTNDDQAGLRGKAPVFEDSILLNAMNIDNC